MTPDELRKKVTQEATAATATLTRELGIKVTDDEVNQYIHRSSGGFW